MKCLWILLISLLTLYGPVELTRVILDWGGFSSEFIFEICFMWLFYAIAMIIASTLIARQPVSQS